MGEDRDAVLLERMKTLVRELPQARMARATGRSRTSLTRYLQGAKLPLEFGVALVEEFGVNPNWLLAGEQPVYLADVPASSAELGNELLEMMRAMDNVSRLKLGALTGKGHSRALREVSDMLDRYGSLRDRLNRMSAPILTDLLDQAEVAGNRRQMDRARALLQTAGRLQKFCDDQELSRKLLKVRGLVYHIDQDLDTALELRTQAFHSTLAADATFSSVWESAAELALVLRNAAFVRRAQRMARIGMAYANEEERGGTAYLQLSMIDVLCSTELGEFDGIPQALERASSVELNKEARSAVETAKYMYFLHRGLWSPGEIAGARPQGFAAASILMTTTYITDDVEVVERALKRCREVMQPQMALNQWHVGRGELLVKALRGRALPPEALAAPEGGLRAVSFTVNVNRALLLRVIDDSRATEAMLDSQQCLEDYGDQRTPLSSSVAIHLKNVLAGIPKTTRSRKLKQLREKAERLCRERIERGFGLLRLIES